MSTKTASKSKGRKTPSKNNKVKAVKVETSAPTPVEATPVETTTPAKAKSNRVQYGFELNFPVKPFTVRQLVANKKGLIKYITLYMRVQKALTAGVLEEVGKRVPSVKRKGRQEIIYQRANVGAAVTTSEPVAVEVVAETAPVVEVNTAVPAMVEAATAGEITPVTA